jgi:hypothetical protein
VFRNHDSHDDHNDCDFDRDYVDDFGFLECLPGSAFTKLNEASSSSSSSSCDMHPTSLDSPYTPNDEEPNHRMDRALSNATPTPYCLLSSGRSEFKQIFSLPSANYMDRQPDISPDMRGMLVDWLVDVAERHLMQSHSLYLAVAIMDHCLDRMPIKREVLQLVGVASMLIAAQELEDSCWPRLDSFMYASDFTYNRAQITEMETAIRNDIPLNVLSPTTLAFLETYQKGCRVDEEVLQLSNYICELTLLEYSFLKHPPPKIAVCAIVLALWSSECPPWLPALERYSGYKPHELTQCLEDLRLVHMNAPFSQLQAIRDKYSAPNPHLCVANIPSADAIPALIPPTQPSL